MIHDDDLNDSLDDIFDGSCLPKKAGEVPSIKHKLIERIETGVIFEEPCTACRGSGRFRSYTGRDIGACFKCKGKGKLSFKTDRATRTHAKDLRNQRKAKAEGAFREEYAAEVAWLKATVERQNQQVLKGKQVWQFPIELHQKLEQYGSLTDGQIGAIRKCMARDAERKAKWEAEKAARPAPAAIDISKIETAFATRKALRKNANAEGVKWLKLSLAHKAAEGDVRAFTFTDAPASGRFEAAILVREGNTKLGRIAGGKFIRSFACDDATEARVIAAASDPAAAAVAYGLEFSHCACCGLELNNPESIERGIGPICAEKWFCA